MLKNLSTHKQKLHFFNFKVSFKSSKFNYREIEEKWKNKVNILYDYNHSSSESGGKNALNRESKFYILNLFPILKYDTNFNLSTMRTYFLSDFYTRYYQLKGRKVLNPIGFDNYDTQENLILYESSSKIQEMLKKLGLYNTECNLETSSIVAYNYLLKEKLKKLAINVNFDNELITSNEENKKWSSWLLNFLEKNDYLIKDEGINSRKYYLKNIENLNKQIENDNSMLLKSGFWPKYVVNSQKDLLGRISETKVKFSIIIENVNINPQKFSENAKQIDVLINTERTECLFGVTFLCLKRKHEVFQVLKENCDKNQIFGIEEELKSKNKKYILLPKRVYAINPINKEKIPLVLVNKNFELKEDLQNNFKEYNIKACVPAHDRYDYAIAKTLSLPIKIVLKLTKEMKNVLESNSNSKSNDLFDMTKTSKSISEIKNELEFAKLTDGPLVIENLNSHQEAFLTNSKEFDFLFVEEARELIANYLIKKNKAERVISYKLNQWLLANVEKHLMNYNKYFNSSHYYLRLLDLNNDFDLLSKEKFRKMMPVDLCICTEEHSHFILYYRYIYKILQKEYFKIDPQEEFRNQDDVVLNLEQELEKELFLPVPFKEIIMIDELNTDKLKTLNNSIISEVNSRGRDQIRLCLLLHYVKKIKSSTIKNNYPQYNDELFLPIEKFFSNLHEINNFILKNKYSFDHEKVIEEIFDYNSYWENKSENNSNNIINTEYFLKEILTINKTIEDKNINLAIEKLFDIVEKLSDNLTEISQFYNFFILLYLDILILIHPIAPFISCELHEQLYNLNKNTIKQDIHEYSIEKIILKCESFLKMIKNCSKMQIYFQEEKKGAIILANNILNNKSTILEQIKEEYKEISHLKEENMKLSIENNKTIKVILN